MIKPSIVACRLEAGRAPLGLMPVESFLRLCKRRRCEQFCHRMKFNRDLFGLRIAGHDCFGDVRAARESGSKIVAAARIPFSTFFIGIWTPIRPVEPTSTSSLEISIHRQQLRHVLRHLSILVFRCRHWHFRNSPQLPARKALRFAQADLNRRGADLVGGEHPGDGRRHFRNDQAQIALLSLFGTFAGSKALDIAKHTSSHKALRCGNGTFDRFKSARFRPFCLNKPVVSGNHS